VKRPGGRLQSATTTKGKAANAVRVALAFALVLGLLPAALVAPHSPMAVTALLLANAYGFVLCLLSLRRTSRRLLRSWVPLTVACAAAAVMTLELELQRQELLPSLLQTVPVSVLAFQVLAGIGCLLLVALPRNPSARAQTMLDQVNVAVVAGVVLWVTCYKDVFNSLPDIEGAVGLTFLRYAADGITVTLLVSICLILRPTGRLATPVLTLLAVGLGGFVVFEVLASSANDPSMQRFLLALGAAYASVAIGMATSSRRTFVRRSPQVARGLAYGQLLPSVASAGVLMVVLFELRVSPNDNGILEWLATSLVACVLVRQVVSWKEEQRLMRLLEARVADRTEALGRREQQFQALVQKSSDVIIIVQQDGTCSYVSPSLQYMFGHSPDGQSGRPILDIVHADDQSRVMALLEMARRRPSESLSAEWRIMHADGSERLVEVLLRNLLDDSAVSGLVINLRDITDRKELEDRLMHQSMHDHLTNLGNRAQLRVRTEQALGKWMFHNQPFCLLVVDINDFKSINDSLGHVIGDQALKTIADRIAGSTRRGDTVVRVDGDEFAVLIEGVAAADPEAQMIADRVSIAVQQPMRIEGRRIAMRASVGLACVSERVSAADDIMRNADLALNSAKQQRAGGVVQFEESMHDVAIRRVELEADLRHALERDELQLFYQPTVEIESGSFQGMEALLRWPHPQKGFIPPLDFIPLAEESGLIVPIGQWVLEQACAQLAKWQMRFPGAKPLKMNVNLSARQFDQPDIVDVVRTTIETSGIMPGTLVLEVTESVLMENSAAVRTKMEALVALGCVLAIDDFGTGYSSLSYLQQYPIRVLKIDRSFVNEIGAADNESEPALVKAIIDIARTLQLQTVAEGIETRAQLDALHRLGCEVGQGFFLAKPAPPIEVQRLLESTLGNGMPLPHAQPRSERS
jgi:diguanylate cyclase (GGDEF)-like protein/PAS domain S-box-containing protein